MTRILVTILPFLAGCAAFTSPDPVTGTSAIQEGISAGTASAVEGMAGGIDTTDAIIGGLATAAATALTVGVRRWLKKRDAR